MDIRISRPTDAIFSPISEAFAISEKESLLIVQVAFYVSLIKKIKKIIPMNIIDTFIDL
jgi:hypothetical protein